MQQLHPRVRAGTIVTARGDTWSVVGHQVFDGGALVTLEGRGRDNRGCRTTLLAPFDRIEPTAVRGLSRRRRQAAIRVALATLARGRPAGGLWTMTDGRCDVLPWQLMPALAVLAGSTRVLLADAVGLGKTLQAGLVAAELTARGLAEHTLVLAPPGLRDMWAAELSERLDLDVAILAPPALAARSRALGASRNPWTCAPVVVSSIDFVKRPEVRAAVEAAPFDLLIVDEAHHLTPGSDRAAVAARLARRAPWLILASATPHGGDPRTFRALLDLGRTGERGEPPMQVFHRTAAEAGLARRRRTIALAVAPTDAEQALIDGLLGYARAMCHGALGARPGVRLVAGVLARRATSSAWAAEQSLQRRLDRLAGDAAPPDADQPWLPWDEHDDGDTAEAAWLGVPGLPDQREECNRLRQLLRLARAAGANASKLSRLSRLLARIDEPAVVFTEFRDTLDACRVAIGGGDTVACLHGGLSAPERRQALHAFLGGQAAVLLATDVAGEGLNLQARARVVVTIEWPWSPQRLEQRIGRVDRLGQSRDLHAVHLTAKGTFEETVVARLLVRAARARDELARLDAEGPTKPSIEAAVLGGPTEAVADASIVVSPLRAVDGVLEAVRIRESRRLAARAGQHPVGPCWAPPAGSSRPGSVIVVVEVTRARAGRLEWSVAVPLEVPLARRPRDRREWAQVCRALAADDKLHRTAAEAARRSADGHGQWRALLVRLRAIRRALASSSAAFVQPSLFDRRAIRDAEARAVVLATLDEYLGRSASLVADDHGEGDVETRVLVVLPPAEASS